MDTLEQIKAESSFLVKLWKTSRYTVLYYGENGFGCKEGGAVGIRANTTEDINEIKRIVDLPVIGIIKEITMGQKCLLLRQKRSGRTLETQAEIIALDATSRKRPTEKQLLNLSK